MGHSFIFNQDCIWSRNEHDVISVGSRLIYARERYHCVCLQSSVTFPDMWMSALIWRL